MRKDVRHDIGGMLSPSNLSARTVGSLVLTLAALDALAMTANLTVADRILSTNLPESVLLYNLILGQIPTAIMLFVIWWLWRTEQAESSTRLLGFALAVWVAQQLIMNLPLLLNLIPNAPSALLQIEESLWGLSMPLQILWYASFCFGIARSARFNSTVGRLAIAWGCIGTAVRVFGFVLNRTPLGDVAVMDSVDRVLHYTLTPMVVIVLVAVGMSLLREDARVPAVAA